MSEAGLEEKEDPSPSKDLLYPWYFSPVTPAPPFVYKREDRAPYEEGDRTNRLSTDNSHIDELIEPSVPRTHSQVAARPLASFRPLHQRPETRPSLDRLYPLLLTIFGANNTSSSSGLDVGTFGPNQYKPYVV